MVSQDGVGKSRRKNVFKVEDEEGRLSSSTRDLSRLKIENKTSADSSDPWAWVKSVILAAFGFVMGYFILKLAVPSSSLNSTIQDSPQGADQLQVQSAPVSPLANESQSSALDATGYVVAQRKAAVSSKATGRLQQLLVKEGDRVAEGQLIGVLENADAQASVREREASLLAAQSRVKTSSAELEDAKKQFDRMTNLKDSGAVSRSDRDAMEARFRKANAAVEASRSDVVVEQARLEKAKVEFDFTLIRAPFAGTVLTKNADVGEVVAPFGSASNARGAVVTIADMDSLQVEADVSESNLSKVKVGQRYQITLDSYPEKKYVGEVSSIVPTVDRAKGTVTVKIRFLDKDDFVIPEMSAKVSLQPSSAAKN